MKIAILGATSHIAKGLIVSYLKRDVDELFLFARTKDNMHQFLKENGFKLFDRIYDFNLFLKNDYDVIINCVGVGTPEKIISAGVDIFFLTEKFDNMVLEYLVKHPAVLYINFSSGAVYGTSFNQPVDHSSLAEIAVNGINMSDVYRIAKLNSEAKHRAFGGRIIDLRIFSYFSRYVDMSSKYLMTEIVDCIKKRKPFVTGPSDIVRDYVHPDDLFQLVLKCIDFGPVNAVYDVYSAAPVKKSEILAFFTDKYNLEVVIKDDMKFDMATGLKNVYYSENRAAEAIEYKPEYGSLETIVIESGLLLLKQ